MACVAATTALGQTTLTDAGMQAYNRGDFATAYRLLQQSAESGDPEAQVNLGYMFARGQFVRMNQVEAMRLYRASAAQGDSEGMNAIGYKYQFGTGVPKDMDLAVEWYCRAVMAGNPRAMNNLANIIDEGVDIAKDEAEARSLWEQAAALGWTNAMYNLGISYIQEPDQDLRKAEMWLRRAAQAGHPDAQALLRRNGYSGPLPPPAYQAALMIPAPKGATGHSKVCAALIS